MNAGAFARCRLRVEGRVQGVGFRDWTVRRARSLGLRGWVRNLPDGSVELEAVGPADALGRLRVELRRGPPLASVGAVVDVEGVEPASGDLPAGFEVRY